MYIVTGPRFWQFIECKTIEEAMRTARKLLEDGQDVVSIGIKREHEPVDTPMAPPIPA